MFKYCVYEKLIDNVFLWHDHNLYNLPEIQISTYYNGSWKVHVYLLNERHLMLISPGEFYDKKCAAGRILTSLAE